MIIHFDKVITDRDPSIYKYIESKSLWALVYFIIDSKARKSVAVQSFLQDIIANPSDTLKDVCSDIAKSKNHDYVMTDILRWVIDHIKYVKDSEKWAMTDRWQTPEETLSQGTGDCEDGAILAYAMAVYLGVPAERLLLMCGDTKAEGHCWLAYRPNEYPLNWCFMDWCYLPDRSTPNVRQKYYVLNDGIYDDPKNEYLKLWFAFNHQNSYKGLMNLN